MVKAVVGSGGKTTYIKEKAGKYAGQGLKVFVTTTTHMAIEKYTLISDNADEIIEILNRDNFVMAGLPEPKDKEKFKCLSEETYKKVCEYADVVLVEADGSKHMPIKFPNENEPVIPDNADEIIIVCGLHALGKRAKEVAFRLELVKNCLGISDDTIITIEHIAQLLQKGYIDPLKTAYPHKNVILCPNGDKKTAEELLKKLDIKP